METHVASVFTRYYIVKAIAAGIITVAVPCFLTFIAMQPTDDNNPYYIAYLLLAGSAFTFFSARMLILSYKSVTITSGEIIVQWYFTRKNLTVPLNEIVSTATTRPSTDNTMRGSARYQTFVITLSSGELISINEGDYVNYHEIKSCLYNYKRNPLQSGASMQR
nr:hypothetical protein [uncultured Mucilaginibacter sp.]